MGGEGRNEHVHVCVRREGKEWAVLCAWRWCSGPRECVKGDVKDHTKV